MLFCLLGCAAGSVSGFHVGVGSADVTGPVQDVVMMGMANQNQKTGGIHMRLRARAYVFADDAAVAAGDAPSPGRMAFVSIDTAMAGYVMRKRVLAKLDDALGAGVYTDANLCISATHSHSGPSGFLQHTIFQFAGSGWVPATLNAMVDGASHSTPCQLGTLATSPLPDPATERAPRVMRPQARRTLSSLPIARWPRPL